MSIAHEIKTLTWHPDPAALGGRRHRRGTAHQAYVPEPIRDLDPVLSASQLSAFTEAEQACRELEKTIATPSLNLESVARQLLRSEAVASSRIEGLVVSHRRLAKAAFSDSHGDFAARSVLQNIVGIEHALDLAANAPAVTGDTFAEIRRAMFEATQDDRHSGVVRDRQNWIGGEATTPANAEFVPPPPSAVPALLTDLAEFCQRADLSPVLQAAIAHAQFETIHPFSDGNGRVGRALIQVVLRRRGLIEHFPPPVSLVLASHADTYIRGLTNYRYGDEREWYEILADALSVAAHESTGLADDVVQLQEEWRERAGRPRRGSAALKLIEALPAHPLVNLRSAIAITGSSPAAVLRAFERLQDAQVIQQTSVGRKNRAFECMGLFALMDEFEHRLGPADRTPAGATV